MVSENEMLLLLWIVGILAVLTIGSAIDELWRWLKLRKKVKELLALQKERQR